MSRGLAVYVDNLRVFSRRGKPIIKEASFKLSEGDLAIVIGRSGSGKTTILRALAGVATNIFGLRVEGSIKIMGSKPSLSVLRDFVSYIPQEPWSAIASPYPLVELTSFSRASRSEALEILEELGLGNVVNENTSCLSPGEIQRLLIAEAYLMHSKVLLIDEALSYLDPKSRVEVAKLIKELVEEGATAIVVDHVLDPWLDSYTKVIMVEDGVAREVENVSETGYLEALESCLKRFEKLRPLHRESEYVIEVDNLWFRYPDSKSYVLKGVSLRVGVGEVVVIKGASGRGKSTLLKVLAGIYRASRGRKVVRYGLQLVPENPLLYISSPTPREELGGDEGLAELAMIKHCLDTPIAFLSGGERRRLAIASAFSRSPKLLLLDEPSVGLDPWSALSVAELISRLCKAGSSVVIATHDPYLSKLGSSVIEI